MIVIIGAGPAGVSAAYHLADAEETVVLEAAAEPGGLCRSFELGNAVFDFGGHAFFTRHDYVRELATQHCASGIYTQPRKAWVYSHGTFLPYPFQSRLYGLPAEVVEDCLVGLCEAARSAGTEPANLADWIHRSFGPGIAKHFLTPYNEKLWAYPLTEISPEWSSDRIVTPKIRAIVRGALSSADFNDFPNATVSYPAQGGFFGLYRGMANRVEDGIRQATVVRVDTARRAVYTHDGQRFDYDVLVSTMPLDRLVAITEGLDSCCASAAATLRWNSLYLVNLVFERRAVTDMHRIYSADPAVPFHKLVCNSNSSAWLKQNTCFGIQAEVSFSEHKAVRLAGLERRVLKSVTEMGIVTTDDRVTHSDVVTVPYAYPVYTARTHAAREHLLDSLREFGILCAGRFGEWQYINSDDAIMAGRHRAEEIIGKAISVTHDS